MAVCFVVSWLVLACVVIVLLCAGFCLVVLVVVLLCAGLFCCAVFCFVVCRFCCVVNLTTPLGRRRGENSSFDQPKKSSRKRVQNKPFRPLFGPSWGGTLSGGHERRCTTTREDNLL